MNNREPLLEIEHLRERYLTTNPEKIVLDLERERMKDGIITLVSLEAADEFPLLRAKMMKELFREFPSAYESLKSGIPLAIEDGLHPLSSIALITQLSVRTAMNRAAENSAEYRSVRQQLAMLHEGIPFFRSSTDVSEELRNFMRHGMGVMMGVLETIPHVYKEKYGKHPTSETLHEYLPSSAQVLFSNLARVDGNFAVEVEKAMGLTHIKGNVSHFEFERMMFDPSSLQFTDDEGIDMLDIHQQVGVIAETRANLHDTRYHGCLAGIVPMNAAGHGKKCPRVFNYIESLLSDAMLEHWAPTVTSG